MEGQILVAILLAIVVLVSVFQAVQLSQLDSIVKTNGAVLVGSSTASSTGSSAQSSASSAPAASSAPTMVGGC